MSKTVLITAAKEDSAGILDLLDEKKVSVVHCPLERYVNRKDLSDAEKVLDQLTEYENIVYGGLPNARFFMKQVERLNKKEAVRNRLNLTLDEDTADFLESCEVPAVCTFAGRKSIHGVEFMLRLRRMGPTLYPCGTHRKEEIPAFLEELDIPVTELELYELEGPEDNELKNFQEKLNEATPDIIVFHSRRAVNRTLAAFPELNYADIHIISADKGVTKHLKEKDISTSKEASGNWKSIADLL